MINNCVSSVQILWGIVWGKVPAGWLTSSATCTRTRFWLSLHSVINSTWFQILRLNEKQTILSWRPRRWRQLADTSTSSTSSYAFVLCMHSSNHVFVHDVFFYRVLYFAFFVMPCNFWFFATRLVSVTDNTGVIRGPWPPFRQNNSHHPLPSPLLSSPLLTSPHLTSPHLTSPHLSSPLLSSSLEMNAKQFEGGWERDGGTSNIDLRFGYSAVSFMSANENGFRFFWIKGQTIG